MSASDSCGTTLSRIDLNELIPCNEAMTCMPMDAAKRFNVLPIAKWMREGKTTLVLVCSDSLDRTQQERVAKHVHQQNQLLFIPCAEHKLPTAIHEHYQARVGLDQLLVLAKSFDEQGTLNDSMPQLPLEFVNALVAQACRMGASDIHLAPESAHLQVRLRIDGVLLNYALVSKSLHNSLLVRIKIMASLDIAETRYPQDGHFRRIIDGRAIDFRVSTFPTMSGENTVIRLIDSQMQLDSLAALNLPDSMVDKLTAQMQLPDGMIVVCGPTGSGKSTTLFALLDQIDKRQLNIVTLEDPVEHRVEGVRQTSIDDSRHWGYAQGLRALLRQDPDVLLIGEVRDPESCAMALRAVSTGHRVLTTVHAACAHTALHRLRELNAGSGALALGLTAIIAQRLLRTICPVCQATDAVCSVCHGTGYHGRQVIMELLEITPDLAKALASNHDITTIQTVSHNAGFSGLRQQAMRLVDAGHTTVDEVNRVLGVSQDNHSQYPVTRK